MDDKIKFEVCIYFESFVDVIHFAEKLPGCKLKNFNFELFGEDKTSIIFDDTEFYCMWSVNLRKMFMEEET